MRFIKSFLGFINKRSLSVRSMCFVLFLCLVVSSCTATREQEIEGDVNEFRSWVNAQTNKLEERTEEDWKNTKADFQRRTQELDQKQERFSDKLKADYQQIKADFKARERERDRLANRNEDLAQWERDLLGQYANGTSISAGNIQMAYSTFIDNVRARHHSWNNDDWEMAEQVLEELNQRKEAFNSMADEAEVRIKAMQMEFAALKAGEASPEE